MILEFALLCVILLVITNTERKGAAKSDMTDDTGKVPMGVENVYYNCLSVMFGRRDQLCAVLGRPLTFSRQDRGGKIQRTEESVSVTSLRTPALEEIPDLEGREEVAKFASSVIKFHAGRGSSTSKPSGFPRLGVPSFFHPKL
jgi:hypothetical protein